MSGTEGNGAKQNRFIGRMTALLTALVALNTLVFSCSERRQSREAKAVAEAQSDEIFWEGAFRELDGLLQDRPAREALESGSSDAVSAGERVMAANWLSRCKLLSERTVQREFRGSEAAAPANADETGEPNAEIAEFPRAGAIRRRALALSKAFEDAMGSNEVVGPACAGLYAAATGRAVEADALNAQQYKQTSPAGTSPDDPAVQTAFIGGDASIVMNRSTPNPAGFDIDVFWCDRPPASGAGQSSELGDVRKNVVEAAAFGRQLSDRADARQRLNGQMLGRIRLRRLSVPAQQLTNGPRYVRSGREIRYDGSDRVEKSLAEAMAGLTMVGGDAEPTPQSYSSTRYYLSAFFCQHGVTPDKPAAAE